MQLEAAIGSRSFLVLLVGHGDVLAPLEFLTRYAAKVRPPISNPRDHHGTWLEPSAPVAPQFFVGKAPLSPPPPRGITRSQERKFRWWRKSNWRSSFSEGANVFFRPLLGVRTIRISVGRHQTLPDEKTPAIRPNTWVAGKDRLPCRLAWENLGIAARKQHAQLVLGLRFFRQSPTARYSSLNNLFGRRLGREHKKNSAPSQEW